MTLSIASSIDVLHFESTNSGLKNISGPKNISYPTSTVKGSPVIEFFPVYFLNLSLALSFFKCSSYLLNSPNKSLAQYEYLSLISLET